jgi:hypothetical protein
MTHVAWSDSSSKDCASTRKLQLVRHPPDQCRSGKRADHPSRNARTASTLNPALYRIACSPWYRTAFHDITAGSNTAKFPPKTFTGYRARPAWDPVTGWGSPNAHVLIPLLARYAAPGTQRENLIAWLHDHSQ